MWIYLGLFAGGYIAFCALLAYRYVYPAHGSPVPPPEFRVVRDQKAGLTYTLPTRFAEGELSGDTLAIFVHGYGGTPSDWLPHMSAFEEKGIVAAALHLRGHGQSPHTRCTFGREEAGDLIALIRLFKARFPADQPPNVMVVGLSLGGAVAWHAAAVEPSLIQGMVTEGAYPRFRPASERWLNQVIPGAASGLRPVFWFAEALSGTRAQTQNPLEDAAKWRRGPALIIQAEWDTLVTQADATEMADAARAELWVVEGVDHAAGSSSPEYLPRLFAIVQKMRQRQPGTLSP